MGYQLARTIPLTEITNTFAFSPDGASLVIATRDKKASTLILDPRDGSPRPAPRFVRYSLNFSDDGALFVAGTNVERFVLNPTKLAKSTFSIPGHPKGITHIQVSPDGRWLAVSKYLDTLSLWYLGGATPVCAFSTSSVSTKQFLFRGDSLGFGYGRREYRNQAPVELWCRCALTPEGAFQGPTEVVFVEGFPSANPFFASPAGIVAQLSPGEPLALYDWELRLLRTFSVEGRVYGATLAAGGKQLLVEVDAANDGAQRDWRLVALSLDTGQVLGALALGPRGVGRAAASPGAERLALLGAHGDRNVYLYEKTAL